MGIFTKGIVLAQHKEPAFSKPLGQLLSPKTDSLMFHYAPISPNQMFADDIIAIAKAAHIVDERDGRPLYLKLQKAKEKKVAAVIADAVDDEPYVSSQINPLIKLGSEVVHGLKLCKRAVSAEKALIIAYKNVTDLETRIPRTVEGVKVLRLTGAYPADIKLTNLRVGEGIKLIIGIGALIHLHRAVLKRKVQSTVFVTVAGNCVRNPMNLEVSLGKNVAQLLTYCGLTDEPTRIVCGGPMTGDSITNPKKTLISYKTRAVLAIRENEKDRRYNCIGCGRCEQVCPVGLNPMYIQRYAQNSYFTALERFDAHMCIECGTCSYICPSKLDVAGFVEKAKQYAMEHFIAASQPEEIEEVDNAVLEEATRLNIEEENADRAAETADADNSNREAGNGKA